MHYAIAVSVGSGACTARSDAPARAVEHDVVDVACQRWQAPDARIRDEVTEEHRRLQGLMTAVGERASLSGGAHQLSTIDLDASGGCNEILPVILMDPSLFVNQSIQGALEVCAHARARPVFKLDF